MGTHKLFLRNSISSSIRLGPFPFFLWMRSRRHLSRFPNIGVDCLLLSFKCFLQSQHILSSNFIVHIYTFGYKKITKNIYLSNLYLTIYTAAMSKICDLRLFKFTSPISHFVANCRYVFVCNVISHHFPFEESDIIKWYHIKIKY